MGKAVGPCALDYGIHTLTGAETTPDTAAAARRTAQAVDALRHGWPLRLDGGPLLQPVETAYRGGLVADTLLISASRAATLKLVNQREAAVPGAPVLLRGADPFDLPAALAVADPSMDLDTPLKGPFKALPLDWHDQAQAALELARIAGILPAFMIAPSGAEEPVTLNAADLAAFTDPARLMIATRARLPVAAADGKDTEIIAFRSPDDTREHVALVIGQRSADRTPLVRLHSECLTGDILGSLKCDCGPQLDAALHAMAHEAQDGGWGVLLYMRQEGRGIGLVNKLRAYRLQDQGFDTVDANTRLGLPDEARDFATAARMLALMNITAIRLMTNNPAKVTALAAEGVTVVERIPHSLPDNPHNARYLATKRDRAGHILP